MNKDLTFRTFREYKFYYFPNTIEEEKIANMLPEELGKYLAQKSIANILQH